MKRITRFFLIAILQVTFLQAFSQDFWEEIILPDSFAYRCMDISPIGDIYLGMRGFSYPGGIYRSTDNAQTWQYLGLTEKPVYALEVCSNGDIIAGVFSGIFKSSDNGNTWYEVYYSSGNMTNIISLSNGYVFAGGVDNLHGIIRSDDFGETWDTVHVFTNYGQENLKALAVSAEGHVYAGTYNMFGEGSIWFTIDLGETWTEISIPDFSPYWPWIFSLAVHPQGDLFAGFYGQGLYRYNFTTQQWTALYLPWVTPDDILFIGDYKIFVGLYQDPNGGAGVIYSEDGGQNFTTLNSGINGGNGGSIGYLFRHPNNLIFALGWGFYKSTVPVFTDVNDNVETETIRSLNYPNPFTDKTIIGWCISEKDKFVNITIVNASGKIILKEKIINNGNYIFHAGNIKSGIYYYSILVGNNLYTGKMICVN
ncbi:MAG: T9SS type A sorting domain-containing protein [Bacteroidetes bacterium]|nr:T9SS type A sorting domain-containing protein [Bacteroidota bacterium]MBL7102974.1 T9SS type A sorting domain-containing protein [Bacteroidales bacterium]